MGRVVPYTIAELDGAIRHACGAATDVLMLSSGRVLAHHRACFEAFLHEMAGPQVDVLRQAARDLSRTGAYQPSDGVWPEE